MNYTVTPKKTSPPNLRW